MVQVAMKDGKLDIDATLELVDKAIASAIRGGVVRPGTESIIQKLARDLKDLLLDAISVAGNEAYIDGADDEREMMET